MFDEAIAIIFSFVKEFKETPKSDGDILLLAKIFRLLNKFHPFPDGNGRTQRIFIRLLAKTKYWNITFQNMHQWEMTEVCQKAHEMNLEPMNALFNRIVTSID